MTIQEVWDRAKEIMHPNCKVCKVCNGVACRGQLPGLGAAGDGAAWTACTEFLARVKINIDTVYESKGQDTTLEIFGKSFKYPILIAPIGGMNQNYNGAISDAEYTKLITQGAKLAGVLPSTGDNANQNQFELGLEAVRDTGGLNIVTLKPWADTERLIDSAKKLEAEGAVAFACDIDAAGFANMGSAAALLAPKSIAELRRVTQAVKTPFILKGVMTAAGAVKAAEAGCAGIVVSTHGGRVIESAPGTCEVLPEIRAAVGDSIKIIVDGGIRTGTDIFKALALGADAAMIGRPYVVAVHGGGAEGVALYTEKLGAQLKNVMLMTGAQSLAGIHPDMIRIS